MRFLPVILLAILRKDRCIYYATSVTFEVANAKYGDIVYISFTAYRLEQIWLMICATRERNASAIKQLGSKIRKGWVETNRRCRVKNEIFSRNTEMGKLFTIYIRILTYECKAEVLKNWFFFIYFLSQFIRIPYLCAFNIQMQYAAYFAKRNV